MIFYYHQREFMNSSLSRRIASALAVTRIKQQIIVLKCSVLHHQKRNIFSNFSKKIHHITFNGTNLVTLKLYSKKRCDEE